MKRSDTDHPGEVLYEYFCEFAGIKFRLVSDDLFLKEIDFYKGKNFRPTKESPQSAPLKIITQYLEAYFNGRRTENFSIIFRHNFKDIMVKKSSSSALTIVLDMEDCTGKEINVYRELVRISEGEKISYGTLAVKSGFPGGARFIGNTMAKNRFPVIIPCHRVIKSDGSMGNFSGGVEIKEKLIKLEKDTHKQ